MSEYYYYSRTDSKKEPISKKRFKNTVAAAKYWSSVKQLSVDIFLGIYEIRKIES